MGSQRPGRALPLARTGDPFADLVLDEAFVSAAALVEPSAVLRSEYGGGVIDTSALAGRRRWPRARGRGLHRPNRPGLMGLAAAHWMLNRRSMLMLMSLVLTVSALVLTLAVTSGSGRPAARPSAPASSPIGMGATGPAAGAVTGAGTTGGTLRPGPFR